MNWFVTKEISENGADIMHLNELHSDAEFLGTVVNRSKYHKLFEKLIRYEWSADWRPCPPPDQHIALLDLKSIYSILGYPVMPFSLFVQQIGPANVHLKIKIDFFGPINAIIIQTITPLAPMKNKIVHHFYSEPTLKAFLFSKFMIYGEAKMVCWYHQLFIAIWIFCILPSVIPSHYSNQNNLIDILLSLILILDWTRYCDLEQQKVS